VSNDQSTIFQREVEYYLFMKFVSKNYLYLVLKSDYK